MVQGVLVRRVRVLKVVDHEVAVGQLLPRVSILVVEGYRLLQVFHSLLVRFAGAPVFQDPGEGGGGYCWFLP